MKSWSGFTLGLVGLGLLAVACSATPSDDGGDDTGSAVSTKNMVGQSFGLAAKELVLTIDDGPGPRTKELVDWLVAHKVPAVFFMMGNNAKANVDSMNYVADHSHLVPGGLLIGNHSLTHTTPLPKQGVDGSIHEIMATDVIIKDAMKHAQDQFSNQIPLFRPPYGAFTALGPANIQKVNDAGASKYVGPIFWDIGGELDAKHSADWACWSTKGITMQRCQQGYIAEANDRGKGLILVHDVHSKTIDMLTGKNSANGVSLIEELQKQGFNFVGLRSHDSAVSDFATAQAASAASPKEVRATAEMGADGKVEVIVDLAASGATKGAVVFDSGADAPMPVSTSSTTVHKQLSPGQHTVTIEALDGAGKVTVQKQVGFVVPGALTAEGGGVDETSHAPCVNYDHLTPKRPFKLFIKKEDCSTAGAAKGENGECYRFDGTLRVAAGADGKAAVHATGADEWSVEYDLTFASDPNDISKVSLVLQTGTGHVVTGKRHAFKNAQGKAVTRDDAPFSETQVDCNAGIWRGTFSYTNGTSEEFLFRQPIEGEPEFDERP